MKESFKGNIADVVPLSDNSQCIPSEEMAGYHARSLSLIAHKKDKDMKLPCLLRLSNQKMT